MKPAETWYKDDYYHGDPLDLIQRIQTDALKAGWHKGMTDAAAICADPETMNWRDCKYAIIKARDAKK